MTCDCRDDLVARALLQLDVDVGVVAKKSASPVGTSVWVADVLARTTNVDCSPSEHQSSNLASRAFSVAVIFVLADTDDRCVCSAPWVMLPWSTTCKNSSKSLRSYAIASRHSNRHEGVSLRLNRRMTREMARYTHGCRRPCFG